MSVGCALQCVLTSRQCCRRARILVTFAPNPSSTLAPCATALVTPFFLRERAAARGQLRVRRMAVWPEQPHLSGGHDELHHPATERVPVCDSYLLALPCILPVSCTPARLPNAVSRNASWCRKRALPSADSREAVTVTLSHSTELSTRRGALHPRFGASRNPGTVHPY